MFINWINPNSLNTITFLLACLRISFPAGTAGHVQACLSVSNAYDYGAGPATR
jgi:hypothetical protein